MSARPRKSAHRYYWRIILLSRWTPTYCPRATEKEHIVGHLQYFTSCPRRHSTMTRRSNLTNRVPTVDIREFCYLVGHHAPARGHRQHSWLGSSIRFFPAGNNEEKDLLGSEGSPLPANGHPRKIFPLASRGQEILLIISSRKSTFQSETFRPYSLTIKVKCQKRNKVFFGPKSKELGKKLETLWS